MAETGFTPIQLYRTATASAVPVAGKLADGELAINTNDGKLFYKNSSGVVTQMASAGSGTGTVSSVSGAGTVNGITLTGTVTTSGSLTLGGTLANVNLTSQVTGTLPAANGGTGLAAPGTSGNVLTSDGTNWTSSSSSTVGAYNLWLVKTSAYTAVTGDQIIANNATAFTITLPASPSVGDTVVLVNAPGGGLLTVDRNGHNINSTAANGELSAGQSSQLVYVSVAVGFLQI